MIGKIELWQIIKDHEKMYGIEFSAIHKNHIIEIVQKAIEQNGKSAPPNDTLKAKQSNFI